MFEFLCKGNAKCINTKSIRAKAFCLLVLFVCAAVVAIGAPLQTLAAASSVNHMISLLAGAIAGSAAWSACTAYVCAAAGVATVAALPVSTIIILILIAMGASIAIGSIVEATLNALDEGLFQDFLLYVTRQLEAGGIIYSTGGVFETKWHLAPLEHCWDWVKTHILGYYDEEVEEPVTYTNTSVKNPFNETLAEYSEDFRGIPILLYSDVQTTNLKTIQNYGYIYSENAYGTDLLIETVGDSEGIQVETTTHGVNAFDNESANIVCLKDKNVAFYFLNSTSETLTKFAGVNVCLPLFNDVDKNIEVGYVVSNLNSDGSYYIKKWTRNKLGLKYFSVDNKLYKFVDYKSDSDYTVMNVIDENGEAYEVSCNVDGVPVGLRCVSSDTPNNPIAYYTLYEDGEIVVKRPSDLEVVSTAKAYTHKSKVNKYYNAKADTIATTAGAIREKEDDGVITGATAGTVSFGITDSMTAAEVTAESKVGDIANVTEMSIADVATEVGTLDVPISTAFQIVGNNIQLSLGELKYKFPFDVIYSAAQWLKALVTVGEPLVIDYNYNVPGFRNPVHVHIDFNKYQSIVTVANWVVLVSCAIGCLIASRKALDAM